MIKHPDIFFQFDQYLTEDDFSVHEHKQIYYVIKQFYDDSREDLSIIRFEAKATDVGFTFLCNNEMVQDLFTMSVTKDDASDSFAKVKKESIRRKYDDALQRLSAYVDDTGDSVGNIVSSVEEGIMEVSSILQYGEHGIINLAAEAEDMIRRLAESPGHLGLDIGFPIWQKHVGELRNGSLHIVISDTGVGKSQWGMRGAILAAKNGIPSLICDSEMNETDQAVRAFGMYMKIPYWILETGYWRLSDDELIERDFKETMPEFRQIQNARMRMGDKEALDVFKTFPLQYVSINGLTVSDAIPFMRQWVMRYTNIDKENKFPQAFLVYDYIKLATVEEVRSGLQEYQLLGLNTSKLHDFMQKYHLPGLTFGQTNRDVDDSLRCIAGSKRIAELCDSVSIFKEKNPEELQLDPNGNHMVKVFKGRHGKRTGRGHVSIQFNGEIGHMEEIGFVSYAERRAQEEEQE